MLQTLNKKVEEVYRNCIGDNEANIRWLNQRLLDETKERARFTV